MANPDIMDLLNSLGNMANMLCLFGGFHPEKL
jgi:hypothetical protein